MDFKPAKELAILDYLLWPTMVGLLILVFYIAIGELGPEQSLGVVGAVAMLFWMLAEWWRPNRQDWRKRDDAQIMNDVVLNALAITGRITLQSYLVVAVVVFLSAAPEVRGYTTDIWPHGWPLFLQIPLCIFLAEGLNYGRHRLLHRVPWLWPIHALHHSVDRVHWLKGGKTHVLEIALSFLVVGTPLVLIGAPHEVLVWYAATTTIIGGTSHANIRCRFSGFCHRIITTPAVHYIHHSVDRDLGRNNLAAVLPVWDILFGTFRHPEDNRVNDVGIRRDPMPGNLIGQILSPFTWWYLERYK